MPLASDVRAAWAVALSSDLGRVGWDPSLGPQRVFGPHVRDLDGAEQQQQQRRRRRAKGEAGRTQPHLWVDTPKEHRFRQLLQRSASKDVRPVLGAGCCLPACLCCLTDSLSLRLSAAAPCTPLITAAQRTRAPWWQR
jgi:hypothetical protein